MAAVFIPPSPQQTTLNMSTRRPPLANVPNGTNSPLRPSAVPSKRSRTASSQQLDIPYGQPPPSKKQMLIDGNEGQQTVVDARDGRGHSRSTSQQQQQQQQPGDSRLFSRRSNVAQPSAFERKLHAARERDRQQSAAKSTKNEKTPAEALDTMRQWQKHYRRAFPEFVFYFDSIPDDARTKCSRQVNALGAREEKFFSRVVTHVVTSRPIPPEQSATNPSEGSKASVDHASGDGITQTVNPSLLERNPEMHVHMSLKNDARREQTNMDILHRARRMGMKIWALEKLQRMIATINDPDIGGHQENSTRSHNPTGGNSRARGETDLSQVLRNELLSGPSDRDHLSSLKELVTFKGPFIYIHDMNEKTRPVMVREYPKVNSRQDGAWPQFRSAPLGRCPFIEEAPSKKEWEWIREQEAEQERRGTPRPSGPRKGPIVIPYKPKASKATAREPVEQPKPSPAGEEPSHQPPRPEMQDMGPPRPGSPRKSSESFIPPQVSRTGPFYTGHEPAASGMQPSNVTSAIRSQMVSSTAAAPGAKAGLSKQVHELKRKVLEKGNGLSTGAPATNGTGDSASSRMNAQDKRPRKSNAKENHSSVVQEETAKPERHGAAKKQAHSQKGSTQKKDRPRDPKPGFCENCRDKFDDFEEHTQTRKHRKFAMTSSNWVELDDLLWELERPLKEEYAHLQHI